MNTAIQAFVDRIRGVGSQVPDFTLDARQDLQDCIDSLVAGSAAASDIPDIVARGNEYMDVNPFVSLHLAIFSLKLYERRNCGTEDLRLIMSLAQRVLSWILEKHPQNWMIEPLTKWMARAGEAAAREIARPAVRVA